MSINLASLKLTDPLVMKAGGGAALYVLGGSRTARMVGLALMGWAAWDYFKAPAAAAPTQIPYDPDAPMPLEQAATSSGDPFVGTRWEGSGYTPSFRPARPGERGAGGKVLPFPGSDARARAGEEAVARMDPAERQKFTDALFPSMSGGINPGPDNAG